MNTVDLIHGDCLDVMRGMEADSFHAIVTDPPYGLQFLGRSWDSRVPGPEYWAEALRVAKPGAHLMAFGGTRTSHRLTCAIEDAGWEIRDTLMWFYGQGMPKGQDIGKAIDRMAGAERECTKEGTKRIGGHGEDWDMNTSRARPRYDAPATEAAKQWDGWNTNLKPSYEPIIMARRPPVGPVARNVMEHGCGGLNIGATRLGGKGWVKRNGDKGRGFKKGKFIGSMGTGDCTGVNEITSSTQGRYPSNCLLHHSPECRCVGTQRIKGSHHNGKPWQSSGTSKSILGSGRKSFKFQPTTDADGLETVEEWQCVDDCPVGMLDRQGVERGIHSAGYAREEPGSDYVRPANGWGNIGNGLKGFRYGDSGGASRFFPTFPADDARFMYCQKASSSERGEFNTHPTVKPINIIRWLIRLCCPPGGLVLDPFMGSGSTCLAAMAEDVRFAGIEVSAEYMDIARRRVDEARSEQPLFARDLA